MTPEEAQAAIAELASDPVPHLAHRVDGVHWEQHCARCGAVQRTRITVDGEGDARLYAALRDFRGAHRGCK